MSILYQIKYIQLYALIPLFGTLYGFTPYPLSLQAEKQFEEALYLDALPSYKELWRHHYFTGHREEASFFLIRLATCYYQLRNYLAMHILLQNPLFPLAPRYTTDKAYLIATLYRKQVYHQSALQLLSDLSEQRLQAPLILEQGLNHFYLKRPLVAQSLFQMISFDPLLPSPYYLAQLYLARLALLNQQCAEPYLSVLDALLPSTHPLRAELLYLKGLYAWLKEKKSQALLDFELALYYPIGHKSRSAILYAITLCCLEQIKDPALELEAKRKLFSKAEQALQQQLTISPHEEGILTLAEMYLAGALHLRDRQLTSSAYALLEQAPFTPVTERQALRLKAEATSDPTEKSDLYAKLAQLFSEREKSLSVKYQILSDYWDGSSAKQQRAWQTLYQWLQQKPVFLSATEREEWYDLAALIGLQLLQEKMLSDSIQLFTIIQEGLCLRFSPLAQDRLQRALAMFYFYTNQFDQSDQQWTQLLSSPLLPHVEVLLWKAKCAEAQGQKETMRTYLKAIYEHDPTHAYAPLAYLHYYSQEEYLQGNRQALKHLHAMEARFPGHPLLMTAYYLIGLDAKKHSNRQDWIATIDFFYRVESLFEELYQKEHISAETLPYFLWLRYRAQFERALANQSLAEESKGAKRRIYLEYAERTFKQLIERIRASIPSLLSTKYPGSLEEAEFHLALAQLKNGKTIEANQTWEQMLHDYQQTGIQSSYWLSQLWYEKGKFAQSNQEYETALADFMQAEKTQQGLSPDQQLEIWMMQAVCHQKLEHYGEAMCLLSKVINEEIVSGLRIQAMLLRAEIYELQGKLELARRQLEAVIKKGGTWGKQAQEKLGLLLKNEGF